VKWVYPMKSDARYSGLSCESARWVFLFSTDDILY
jgi:hypothetical protein